MRLDRATFICPILSMAYTFSLGMATSSLPAGAQPSGRSPSGTNGWREISSGQSAAQGDATTSGEAVQTFNKRSSLSSQADLTMQVFPSVPLDARTDGLVRDLLSRDSGKISDDAIRSLEMIIPAGNPLPSKMNEANGGGETRRVNGKDILCLWTKTKTIGVCQPLPGGGSRSPLINQLDYWLLKPLSEGQGQLIHWYITSMQDPFLELPQLEAFLAQSELTESCEETFKSADGNIIATARPLQAGNGNGLELQLALLRRIGTKPIPFFYTTVGGGYNPRIVTSKPWHVGPRQVLVLLASTSKENQSAVVVSFDSHSGKVVQTLSGSVMMEAEDMGQKGVIIKEAIGSTGINRPRFFIFSNSTGLLVEMTSVRPSLAKNELDYLKYKSLLRDGASPETQLAIACLLIDCEGEEAKEGLTLMQGLRDSTQLKANKKLYQSLKKMLDEFDREMRKNK